VLGQIKKDRPATEVLILTSSSDEEHLVAAISAGRARLPAQDDRGRPGRRLGAGGRPGESVLEPRIAARLVRQVRDVAARHRPLDHLSPREREVLAALARPLQPRDRPSAVHRRGDREGAVSSILSKLHLADRTQAAIFAPATPRPLDRALEE
jgi:DNA-binding NarL/FixJ family response regulator